MKSPIYNLENWDKNKQAYITIYSNENDTIQEIEKIDANILLSNYIYELNDYSDVVLNDPAINDILYYTGSYWTNSAITFEYIYALNHNYNDVNITIPQNGEYLIYNPTVSEWINYDLKNNTKDIISGTNVISIGYYDNTNTWVNQNFNPYNTEDSYIKLNFNNSGNEYGVSEILSRSDHKHHYIYSLSSHTHNFMTTGYTNSTNNMFDEYKDYNTNTTKFLSIQNGLIVYNNDNTITGNISIISTVYNGEYYEYNLIITHNTNDNINTYMLTDFNGYTNINKFNNISTGENIILKYYQSEYTQTLYLMYKLIILDKITLA